MAGRRQKGFLKMMIAVDSAMKEGIRCHCGRLCRSLTKTIVPVLVCMAVGCGCEDILYPYARKKPAKADLVGTWRIDVDKSHIPFTYGPNMERVPFSFGPRIENAKLVLREDGSFVAVGLPRVAFDGASGTGDVAGQGKWEIDKGTQDWWSVRLEWPIRSDTHVVHYEPLYVRHQSPEHLLHKDIDLDMGHAIVFYREVKGRQKGDVRKTGDRAADR